MNLQITLSDSDPFLHILFNPSEDFLFTVHLSHLGGGVGDDVGKEAHFLSLYWVQSRDSGQLSPTAFKSNPHLLSTRSHMDRQGLTMVLGSAGSSLLMQIGRCAKQRKGFNSSAHPLATSG